MKKEGEREGKETKEMTEKRAKETNFFPHL
jgi:hypothetical protein